MDPNYRVEAIAFLLQEDCVLTGYYPLIPLRHTLVENLLRLGCRRKADCMALSDDDLLQADLPNAAMVGLFRAFLKLYDAAPAKFREIPAVSTSPEEAAAFRELYHLPGVKATRARLYFLAGYPTLSALAAATPQTLLAKTEEVIRNTQPNQKAPYPKELKTHIAVAKAFTDAV